jgi:outer membrane lipoprotein-sorting protein
MTKTAVGTLLAVFAGCCIAFFPPVPARSGQPETSVSTEAVLHRIERKAEGLNTLRADFVQSKQSRLLASGLETRGRVLWRKPDRLRWEVREPEPLVMIVREDQLMIHYVGLGEAEILRRPGGESIVRRILGFENGMEAFRRSYDVEAEPSERPGYEDHVKITLEPSSLFRARAFEKIEVFADRERFLPRMIVFYGEDGPGETIELYDIVENPRIPEGEFALDLPDDVEVKQLP